MRGREMAAGPPLCPSAQPQMAGAVVFGVAAGTANEPRVGYLTEPVPVTDALLELSGPVSPDEIFRFGAPCAGAGCMHFDGRDCRLAKKLVQILPRVSETLPACSLRPGCRWWRQEGRAACMRCPQVVTATYDAPDALRMAADPAV